MKALVIDLDETVAHLQLQVENLKIQLARSARANYGRSSERHRHQLHLALEALEIEVAATTQRAARVRAQRKPAEGASARLPFPEHLQRKEKILPAPEQCPGCAGALRELKAQPVEMLEWVPGNFKVLKYVREIKSCARCDTVVSGAAPPRALGQSRYGASVAAHILVSKYRDHAPLYRQSGIYERQGVDLPRSTLADIVASATGT